MIKKGHFFKAIVSAFSVSVFAQVIGLVRQMFIAAYFGISRGLDVYFMTYAIAMLLVFAFGVIFDTVSIPHLVKKLEDSGYEAFRKLTGSIFTFAVAFSVLLTALFVLLTPLFAKLMAAGFSDAERRSIGMMALYFIPWTAISLPYYALCSFYKSIRHFNVVFLGEVVISVVSLIFIIFFHSDTRLLPLAYFSGYMAAFVIFFILSFRYFRRAGRIFTAEMKKIYRNFIELFGANQFGSVSSIAERALQSFLPSGGVSVLAYSSQITTNMGGMLSFRDIFLVPLSVSRDRNARLERAVIGLSAITIPVMFFFSYYSADIVRLLFRRGRFDSSAAELTASVLSIYALSLLPSVAGLPAFRMFQVIDRIKNTAVIYAVSIFNFAAFGSFFVLYLKWGVCGMALTVVISSYISNVVSFCLLNRMGVKVNFIRIFKYMAYFFAASFAAVLLLRHIPIRMPTHLSGFLFNGMAYCALVAAFNWPLKDRLLHITVNRAV